MLNEKLKTYLDAQETGVNEGNFPYCGYYSNETRIQKGDEGDSSSKWVDVNKKITIIYIKQL
jgi:hypothetical protein